MKKLFIIFLAVVCLPLISCSSDDDSSGGSDYPQTVNIKYEITTTRNAESEITTTLDNATETYTDRSLPFSETYAQTVVNDGTYVKLTYNDQSIVSVGPGGSSWTDYTADLKIYVGNTVVKSETFNITEGNSGLVLIDYTFD